MPSLENIQMKLQQSAGAIQNNRYISSITNGLMSAMPITIVGAIGSLINGLPIQGYQDFLVSSGLKTITSIPAEITTNLLSLYIVFLVAAKFAETYDLDGIPAGLLGLMSFFIVTPFTYSETGTMSAYPSNWLGATGLFTAFIIGLLAGRIYSLFSVKGWVIKMPAGVPPTVSKSFSGLVPGFAIAFVMLLIRYLTSVTPFGDLHSLIFSLVATPLTKLGGSFTAMLIALLVAQLLWFIGVHGTMVVISVFMPIWTPLSAANLGAFNAGQEIPNIVSLELFFMVVFMGSGATLGLVIAMARAKSQQFKTLGKLSLIPNAVGINEPVIFGSPVIMNFTLAIPFILMPVLILILAYVGMLTGILPYLQGISAPLGTPVILGGLIMGGWKWAVFQALMIVLSYVIYKPFFNIIDKQAYAKELEAEKEIVKTESDAILN